MHGLACQNYPTDGLLLVFPKLPILKLLSPLAADEKENGHIEYQMDVDGPIYIVVFHLIKVKSTTGLPVSLVLIEDYIVLYEHMVPIHLNRIMSASDKHIEDSKLGYIH